MHQRAYPNGPAHGASVALACACACDCPLPHLWRDAVHVLVVPAQLLHRHAAQPAQRVLIGRQVVHDVGLADDVGDAARAVKQRHAVHHMMQPLARMHAPAVHTTHAAQLYMCSPRYGYKE